MAQLKLAGFFGWPWRRKEDIAHEVDEEMGFHLEARTDELVGEGVEPGATRA